MHARFGPSQVCATFADRPALTVLLYSSARSPVRPLPSYSTCQVVIAHLGKKRAMEKMNWISGSWTFVGLVRMWGATCVNPNVVSQGRELFAIVFTP